MVKNERQQRQCSHAESCLGTKWRWIVELSLINVETEKLFHAYHQNEQRGDDPTHTENTVLLNWWGQTSQKRVERKCECLRALLLLLLLLGIIMTQVFRVLKLAWHQYTKTLKWNRRALTRKNSKQQLNNHAWKWQCK